MRPSMASPLRWLSVLSSIRIASFAFAMAQRAFLDPDRVIAEDTTHSTQEERFYCIGRVGDGIITVRFTYRSGVVRIFGAGYWRKGKKLYEKTNEIHG